MVQEQSTLNRLPDDPGDLVQHIARELNETEWAPRAQIERIVEYLGPQFAQEMLLATWRVEAEGGLMVLDGSRRRTPGGVFFYLIRQRLIDEHRADVLDILFPVKSKPSRSAGPTKAPRTKAPPALPPRMRPRRKAAGTNETGDSVEPPRLHVTDLPRLWMAVSEDSESQIVSVRNLALAWYGAEAAEVEYAIVEEVIGQEQPYFVAEADEPGYVRVRTAEELNAAGVNVLHASRALQPGVLLLLGASNDKLRIALCRDVNVEGVHVFLPTDAGTRTRYERSTIREVIGMWPEYPLTDEQTIRQMLSDILNAVKRWQWQHSLRWLAEQMEAGCVYRLVDLAERSSIAPDDLIGRLGLAMTLNANPNVFVRQDAASQLHQESCYTLHAAWESAMSDKAVLVRPDQAWIQSVIDRHLGKPADLYRRSINPDTGEVTLAFHFPDVAQKRYAEAIDAAMQETGVPIHISSRPRQDALMAAAHEVLPRQLTALKTSVYQQENIVRLRCKGAASEAEVQQAVAQFQEQTGWRLEVQVEPGLSA